MEAEVTKEATDETRKYEIEPKGYRDAVNDAEVERDSEKPEKEREKPKQMKDDEQKKRRVMNIVQMQGIPKYPSQTVLKEPKI